MVLLIDQGPGRYYLLERTDSRLLTKPYYLCYNESIGTKNKKGIDMHIKPPRKSKKIIITISLLILVLTLGVALYAYIFRPFSHEPTDNDVNRSNSNSKTESTKDSKESKAPSETTKNQTTTIEKEKDNPTQYEGPGASATGNLTGVVNYSDVQEGSLIIRTTIDQLLASGTCTLTLSKSGQAVTKTANIVQGGASSSSCDGFNVPVAELGSGKWNIQVNIESGDRKGSFNSEVTI